MIVDLPKAQAPDLAEHSDWKDHLGAGLEVVGTVAGGVIGGYLGKSPAAVMAGASLGHSAGSIASSFLKDDPNEATVQRNAAIGGAFKTGPLAVQAYNQAGQHQRYLPQPGVAQPQPQNPYSAGMSLFGTPSPYFGGMSLNGTPSPHQSGLSLSDLPSESANDYGVTPHKPSI